MKNTAKGYILATITIIIWSSTFILTKLLLDLADPIEILVMRLTIAIIMLFIIYPKVDLKLEFKTELLFCLSGVSLASYFIFENTALDYTYSSNVGLLVALSPLFTAIIVSVKEKKSYFIPKNIIGLSLALIGVGMVVFGKEGIRGINPIGDILAISAALMFSFYTGFLADVTKKYHIVEKTRKVFIYVLVTFIIYAVVTKQSIHIARVETDLVFGVLYLGIMASSFAFIFWNKAIDLIGTFKTNLFIYLIPLVTMLFSALIFDDPITLLKMSGALLIITGLYITERKKRLFKKEK